MSILNKRHFTSEKFAFRYLEGILWPDGPVCPHCGSIKQPYDLAKTRVGLRKCRERECRKQFTVRIGTVFESSHIPLHKWLQAAHLLSSSKKGISSHQLSRILEITPKSAWFLAHRLRYAMEASSPKLMGGEGKVVEMDETYYGQKEIVKKRTKRGKPAHSSKPSIVSLVERGGNVRSFHVDRADKVAVTKIINDNIDRRTRLHTDEAPIYKDAHKQVADHQRVRHASGEYVRGDVHTNSVEGFFGIFKRGMRGTYQHCKEKHLHRYLAEFDLRYSQRNINDTERTEMMLSGAVGKRLTFEQPIEKYG